MREFDPELPWGSWLRIEPCNGGDMFVDEQGRAFHSIRDALWVGRLGMPSTHPHGRDEKLELLHAVLATHARRIPNGGSLRYDLFHCKGVASDWFMSWVYAQGLLVEKQGLPKITSEGWAILLALDATRPVAVRQMRPDWPSIRCLLELGRGPVGDEDKRAEVEAAAQSWKAAFLRRQLGDKASIVLSRRGEGPIPVMTTVWSLAFGEDRHRDLFYSWLCERLERWPEWAEIAGGSRGSDLTRHLLMTMVAGADPGMATDYAPPPLGGS